MPRNSGSTSGAFRLTRRCSPGGQTMRGKHEAAGRRTAGMDAAAAAVSLERNRVVNAEAEAGKQASFRRGRGFSRALGLGLITGAADDDPSAIGTYAAAGATIGPSFLWTALVTFPMMFAVVYLSAKLGQVAGKGLFAVIRDNYPKWILYSSLTGLLFGNVIEA